MRCAFITGANGGIGMALCRAFSCEGYRVIASDLQPASHDLVCDAYIQLDLDHLCRDSDVRSLAIAGIRNATEGASLKVVINNAAMQIVKSVEQLTVDDWSATFNVNALAPFLLVQSLLPELVAAKGSVVNISSIHSKLTKPEFTAYSTSKAAMDGLTRSLAVELGGRVRVNAISPAAISTPMLLAGFEGRSAEFQQLGAMHPTGGIGNPAEVAALALYLASGSAEFINGATLAVDGGIGVRLHDPV
ncbi:MAG: SDR family oxidoreductase [Porticoccus sp.]|uniref:SDR family NAD(P)-dependent oxidoreductase n=1 Tax=Porticoccus sp. TaxID=2024853 RepID=UPI00329A7B54